MHQNGGAIIGAFMSVDEPLRSEAFRCAQAAWLAYLESSELAAESAAAGFVLRDSLERRSHAAIVLDRDDVRIVAFRGTDEAADWWTNLNILFRRTAWGIAHRGFWDATDLFWPGVQRHVQDAVVEGRRVWLSGHSLGGAMATIASARLLCENERAVDGLCTFGQPPVGGGKFRRNCDRVLGTRYVRIVNHTDSVVDGGLFSHAGHLWYFDTGGRLHLTSKPFVQSVRDQWKANEMLGGLYMFGAHGMKQYLPLLEPASAEGVGGASRETPGR
jgi:triacylglycerol lipase